MSRPCRCGPSKRCTWTGSACTPYAPRLPSRLLPGASHWGALLSWWPWQLAPQSRFTPSGGLLTSCRYLLKSLLLDTCETQSQVRPCCASRVGRLASLTRTQSGGCSGMCWGCSWQGPPRAARHVTAAGCCWDRRRQNIKGYARAGARVEGKRAGRVCAAEQHHRGWCWFTVLKHCRLNSVALLNERLGRKHAAGSRCS